MSGTIPLPTPTLPTGPAVSNFEIVDIVGQRTFDTPGMPYPGPLPGINNEYVDFSQTDLTIVALTPSVFMNSGAGDDTLIAFAGRNYLDGGTGNNVLVGGTGLDSFEIAAGPNGSLTTDIIKNFHATDDLLMTGLTPADFRMTTSTVVGVYGSALDITATSIRPSGPMATLIIPGYSAADVTSGRITVVFEPRGMVVLAH